jgi:hypothetical protein
MGLNGPDFRAPISSTCNKIFIDKPHFLRWFGMAVNDHTRVCVSCPIVVLDPVLSGASDDFAGIKLKGCYWEFESVSFGYGPHSDIPYLLVSH